MQRRKIMEGDKLIRERRTNGQGKKFASIGVIAFLVIAAAVLLVFICLRFDEFSNFLSTIFGAMSPVIVGIVLAYLLNPFMSFFENGLSRVLCKHARKITRAKKVCRVISLILTMVIFVLCFSIVLYLLIPELTDTVMGTDNEEGLVDILPKQSENLKEWFSGVLNGDSKFSLWLRDAFEKGTTYIEDFINDKVFNYTSDIVGYVASGVWSVFGIVYDILIGIVFSVYILLAKDTFGAHAKKIVYSVFKRRRANVIIRVARQCHYKFTGAITGKIVDSVIIGVLCFIGMFIMDLPYRVLISVIVAVTNVIPFFGPYIGGIPSAFLILCFDPLKALYFVIFIIILQQFDCNLLTPHIVGDSIGLSPFWVLFACVVFGALFGLPGMLLGVPGMACIYMIIKEIVEYRLKRKGLHPETGYYYNLDSVDEHEMVVVDPNEDPVKILKDEYEERMRKENELPGQDDEDEDDEDAGDDENTDKENEK